MTILFESDFDDPSFSDWDYAEYVGQVDTPTCNTAYSATNNGQLGMDQYLFLGKGFVGSTLIFAKFNVRFSNLQAPSGDVKIMDIFDEEESDINCALYLTPSLTLRYESITLGSDTGTTVLQTDTWYCIVVIYQQDVSAECYVILDGEAECTLSGNTSGELPMGIIDLYGSAFDPSGEDYAYDNIYFGGVVVDDSDYPDCRPCGVALPFESKFDDDTFSDFYYSECAAQFDDPICNTDHVVGTCQTPDEEFVLAQYVAPQDALYVKFMIRWEGFRPSPDGSVYICGIYDEEESDILVLSLSEEHKLILEGDWQPETEGTTILEEGKWYCIKLYAEISASATCWVKLDDVEEISISGDTSRDTQLNLVDWFTSGFDPSQEDFFDQQYLSWIIIDTSEPECDSCAYALPVQKNWRVYITSSPTVEYHWLSIDFEKTHPSSYPDKFTVVLAGQHTDLNHFDIVEIKKDDVTRFYGYIEKIEWNSNKDTIISGRGRKLFLWKKWTERFVESRDEMAGFFGHVDAGELIKFLMHCPVSDFPLEDEETWDEYPRHKVGWGMNPRGWDVRASESTIGTHATYAIMRLLGFYWRNRGTDSATTTLMPDGGNAGDWTDSGGGGCSGAGCLDDCSDDAEYIESGVNGDITGEYTFDDLPATATGINDARLVLRIRRTFGWLGRITLKVEVNDGDSWHIAGYVEFDTTKHKYATFYSPKWILDTVDKVNAAKVRITRLKGVELGVQARIYCMQLWVDYSDSGTQEIGDYYEINFNSNEERVTGILVQSRVSPDQFPADYCIDKMVELGDENFNTYTVYDPAVTGHASIASAIHIDHDQYRNEDTGVYKDFGSGYFTDFIHEFKFRTQASIPQDTVDDLGPVFTPYALTNTVDDLYTQSISGTDAFIAVYVHYRTSPPTGPSIALRLQNGAAGTIQYNSTNLTVTGNTWYYCTVTKSGQQVKLEITNEDGTESDVITATIPTSDVAFQYIWAGITWNTAYNLHCDGDIEYFHLLNWEQVLCVEGNTCQDLIHSWTPTTMSRIRIRLISQDITKSWQISQVYVYKADKEKYCVVEET